MDNMNLKHQVYNPVNFINLKLLIKIPKLVGDQEVIVIINFMVLLIYMRKLNLKIIIYY